MKRAFLIFTTIFALSGFVSASDIEIELVNGNENEMQTKKQLERLLDEYDVSKWVFTKKIRIEEDVIPHSHPVLTLSTRHLKDDELLLSTFVHEQIHWFVGQDEKKLAAALDEFRKIYPKVPSSGPEGARDEDSTYLHIAVVYLEYRAVRELLGELRAKQVMDFWATDHYTWIYKTVRDEPRKVGEVMFRRRLIPGLGDPAEPVTETGFVPVGDTRLFYEKIGSGKDVVIVPFHFFMFRDFKRFAKGRTMVFYDARNRGRSDRVEDESKITIQEDVEDIERIRKHFGFGKISLIGESYVGLLVVMYAMKYPQNVDRIVQIGAVPFKFGTEYPPELMASDQTPVPDPELEARVEELRERGFVRTNPREFCEEDWKVSQQVLVGNQENASKVASPCDMENEWPVNLERHFGAHFTSVQKLDISPSEIAKVKSPVLTIHGTRDRNAPYGSGKQWSETLPDSKLVTVEGAAHFPWIDDPDTVFDAIGAFLPSSR